MAPPRGAPLDTCGFGVAAALASDAGPGRTAHLVVAGGDRKPVLQGLRELSPSTVALLHLPRERERARKLRATLSRSGVASCLARVDGPPFEGLVAAAGKVAAELRLSHEAVLVNVAAGSAEAGCAMTTAAYLHGLPAFTLERGRAVHLPVAAFGYRELLAEEKAAILRVLGERRGTTLAGVGRRAGLDLDEVREVVFGRPPERGLVGLGLVAPGRGFGRWRRLALTPAAEVLLRTGVLL